MPLNRTLRNDLNAKFYVVYILPQLKEALSYTENLCPFKIKQQSLKRVRRLDRRESIHLARRIEEKKYLGNKRSAKIGKSSGHTNKALKHKKAKSLEKKLSERIKYNNVYLLDICSQRHVPG